MAETADVAELSHVCSEWAWSGRLVDSGLFEESLVAVICTVVYDNASVTANMCVDVAESICVADVSIGGDLLATYSLILSRGEYWVEWTVETWW